MSTGLLALLDDVAGLAKVAAATLDDVGAQTAKAGAKAFGVVIDDSAATPSAVRDVLAARELPMVAQIALGSLRNKLLFLLPGAVGLSLVAPWAIEPLLMAGGAYLCVEGVEKIWHAVAPAHPGREDRTGVADPVAQDAETIERTKVRGAIATDFVLSAEIMTIAVGAVPHLPFWEQAVVLAIVGIGTTLGVYGAVAVIVKIDDAGLAMARSERPVSAILGRAAGAPLTSDRAIRPATRAVGRALVVGMPRFLVVLSDVGLAAMVWVGGGILVHGLAGYGLPQLEHAIHRAGAMAAIPPVAGAGRWLATAAGSGLVGLGVGALLLPLVQLALAVRRRRTGRP